MKALIRYTLMMELSEGRTGEVAGEQMADVADTTQEAIIDAITPYWLSICLDCGATSYSAHYDALVIAEAS